MLPIKIVRNRTVLSGKAAFAETLTCVFGHEFVVIHMLLRVFMSTRVRVRSNVDSLDTLIFRCAQG